MRSFHRILLFTLACFASSHSFAKEWRASIVPASLEEDKTIRVVAGTTSALSFYLQADRDTLKSAQEHKLRVEFDLPEGFEINGEGGYYEFIKQGERRADGRVVTEYDAIIQNRWIPEKIGSRLTSSWQNHVIFIQSPDRAAADETELHVVVRQGDYEQKYTWPLALHTFSPPKNRLKMTTIGLWDYNYSRATTKESAQGVANLFFHSGVSFVQSASEETYRRALEARGIVTGGNTHHAYFYDSKHSDYKADGSKVTSDFADAEAISNLPEGAEIPGVSKLVEHARISGGMASFDLEPRGWGGGFSEVSVAAFCEKYKVNEQDFERFRSYVAEQGMKSFEVQEATLQHMWKQWTEFRSEQMGAYTRRIYEAFKKELPEGRLLNTTSKSYGSDTTNTRALGTDNSAMAPYADIIAPQFYFGYGAAATKLTMRYSEGWREVMKDRGAKSQLWPLLLVRHAGATPKNTPPRLRQQIIGSLAHGANGVVFYYPGLMDAPYWEMLARTTELVAEFEDFYQKGTREDKDLSLLNSSEDEELTTMWPSFAEKVTDPLRAYTIHKLGEKRLFTFFNMDEEKDQVFELPIALEGIELEKQVRVEGKNKVTVKPLEIGFIVTSQVP